MNACKHYLKASCVHGPKRVSIGTCARCPAYTDSGKPRVQVTVKRTVTPPKPIPRERWGEGLNEWVAQREPQDVGIGSTLARIGTPKAKAILIQVTHGTGCKCKNRVAAADALYPY